MKTEQHVWKIINEKLIFYSLLLLLLLLGASLWENNTFIYRSLFPCFCFMCCTAVLLIYAGTAVFFSSKKPLSIPITLYVELALTVYISLRSWCSATPWQLYSYYMVNVGLLLWAVTVTLQFVNIDLKVIYLSVLTIAAVESVYCMLQVAHVVASQNEHFPVTGTWDNPNVTAMFLAMSVSCVWTMFTWPNPAVRKTGILLLALIIGSILLLKCRTAVIGALLSVTVLLNYRYAILKRLFRQGNTALIFMTLLIVLAAIVPIIRYTYQAKKRSADGRKLIWKISASMIAEKPLLGYGYGSFEKNYNLFQSRYFKNGDGSAQEEQNAGFVKMTYNEILQNAVEGGLVGAVLFTLLLLSLLVPTRRKGTGSLTVSEPGDGLIVIAYAGVFAFSVMSLVNFTIQAIPVICLLVLFAAIISQAHVKRIVQEETISVLAMACRYTLFKRICSASLFFLGATGIVINIGWVRDNLVNKEAAMLTKKNNATEALKLLGTVSNSLSGFESYWVNYANTLFQIKNYKEAIAKYQIAARFTSDPRIYCDMAVCYENAGDNNQAVDNLVVAKYIAPNHLLPRFNLMNLYLKTGDTSKAIGEGRDLLLITPKIASTETRYYQQRAAILLKKLGGRYHQRFAFK